MDNKTLTPAGLVTEQTVLDFGSYSTVPVDADTACTQIVESSAVIATIVNGRENPAEIVELVTDRMGTGFGSAVGTVYANHHGRAHAMSGVIVGVNEMVVQFSDEHKRLHTVPLTSLFGLILH
ncbi:MAG: hypothetical protein GX542_12295 [Rhodococcus sp.]|nr:hypothetical protein [Rhodococcus sp. (in: high G+C Gram-positive bacteria)]